MRDLQLFTRRESSFNADEALHVVEALAKLQRNLVSLKDPGGIMSAPRS